MAQTVIRGAQILNNTVQRQDLDTSTVGQAVVTKIIQGSGITLSSTGADSGTGDVTVSSPDVVSTDAGNIATLGTDNHILVPQSQIWSVRLRSFNAIGNPNFEVDQRGVHTGLANPASLTFLSDRWQLQKSALTAAVNSSCLNFGFGLGITVPGTSYAITQSVLQLTLTTAQATLGANDFYQIQQIVEGPWMRELSQDVHSISLLVQSTVTPLTFAVVLRDTTGIPIRSLVKLCTLTTTGWTLIKLPNIPVWGSGGLWSTQPGAAGYLIDICLAAGTSLIAPAADTWQNGNFIGAPGMSNWLASPVNSTVNLAFIQDEPGALCTTPIDCPFTQNYDECLRYFQKSYDYGTLAGTVTNNGARGMPLTFSTTVAPGPVSFHKPMAKVPTVTIYNAATGAANSVQDQSAVNHSGAAAQSLGLSGFGYVGFTTAAGPGWIFAQYLADTGW